MKFSAHRSIDAPRGESDAILNQQAMSFSHTMFGNHEIEFQFRTEDDIIRFCASRLARYKCPEKVWFVDEVPQGLGGKVLRRALR